MSMFAMVVAEALTYASWLFLISVGLTLILGVLRILNVAHGSLYALGAYTGATLVTAYLSGDRWPYGAYLVLLGAAVLVGVVVGPLLERGILQWFYRRDHVLQLLATFAVFLILEDAIKLIFGVNPYFAFEPYGMLGYFELMGIPYPWYSGLLLVVAVLNGVLLWWFINRTRFGRLIVAVVHDPDVSVTLGINLHRVYLVTFIIGATLAAVGGAFTAPMISVVPGIAAEVIVLAFAVVAIGGFGSLEGAALGSLLVALIRVLAIQYFPALEVLSIYFVMAAVLLVRPYGLFARQEVRRI